MDIIKQIADTPVILKEIYGDLAKPGVQQVGRALSTIIGLGNTVLWPLALLNEKSRISLDINLKKYREKLENIPHEEICPLPPEIGVPIVEKFSFVTNEELSGMYAELLAKASQKSTANVAHPSFVNAINNISPDEAILLCSVRAMPAIPYIEVRLTKRNENEWQLLDSMRPGLSCIANLQFPRNLAAYISNLEGLGILHCRQDIYMVGPNVYEPLEEDARNIYRRFEEERPEWSVTLLRGKIEITPFGKLFIQACFVK